MVNKSSFVILPSENNEKLIALKRSEGNVPIFKSLSLSSSTQLIEDQYIITSKLLGQGANSKVVLGYNLKNLQKSAIKIVNYKKLSQLSRSKLQKEIEILTKLKQHPNDYFVKLQRVFNRNENNKEKLHLAMEYIAGCELFELCTENPGGIPERIAKQIIYKILIAIKELHNLQICHLDLKLENIMYIKETNSVKIIDFGFSQFTTINGELNAPQILQNTFCGSIHYAAPELLKKTPFDGKKADVWSLGVLFFALFAGTFPFDDDHTSFIFSKIKNQSVEYPLFFSNTQIDLLSMMLEKDPKDRSTIDVVLSHPYFANVNTLVGN